MTSYINRYAPIAPSMPVQPKPLPYNVMSNNQERQVEPLGTNILEQYLRSQGISAAVSVVSVNNAQVQDNEYHNDLRSKFKSNDAKIMGVIIRSLGAKDVTGNELLREGDTRGNFVNAVSRLDEMKNLGINTLHVLPVNPPGKHNAIGTAGSVYAPALFVEENGDLAIDPQIIDENPTGKAREEIEKIYEQKTGKKLVKMDKNDQDVRYAQFKYFINECHRHGISVMLDLPSCASYDLFLARKDLMAFEKDGTPKTPQGWDDIRMFDPWEDKSKGKLNEALLQMHKDFTDSCIDLGVDGIRSDVARTKPTQFWHILTDYSRQRDPEFAWLAESYTYEDASPQLNMNYDRPEDSLRAGFDSYYGQYHIFNEWNKASELINYVKENLKMSQKLPAGKSLIGSFGTHDDISIMNHGGVRYSNLVSGIQATLPMLNPYYFDGYQTGDDYIYDFENQTDKQTDTDSEDCDVHRGKPDIFNFSRPLIGKHPEIGEFMKATLDAREKYKDIIERGSFIPLEVKNNDNDTIITYARHYRGKTLLVVANRDLNTRQSGKIVVPGLSEKQSLKNLFPTDGESSEFQANDGSLTVDLGPGRIHMFEINTPEIEKLSPEVLRQKL